MLVCDLGGALAAQVKRVEGFKLDDAGCVLLVGGRVKRSVVPCAICHVLSGTKLPIVNGHEILQRKLVSGYEPKAMRPKNALEDQGAEGWRGAIYGDRLGGAIYGDRQGVPTEAAKKAYLSG